MAKSRSKSASRGSRPAARRKSSSKTSARNSGKNSTKSVKSSNRSSGIDPASRPTLKAGDVPDDIELLNVHRYPESMPASVVAFVRNDRGCQRRLEELVKIIPGKRGQSGFNQLFQQKLNESSEGPGPAPTVYRAGDGQTPPGGPGAGSDNKAGSASAASTRATDHGGIGGFFRKLFS